MSGFDEIDHPRDRVGRFADKEHTAPEVTLSGLAAQSPVDIDTVLAELHYEVFKAMAHKDSAEQEAGRYQARLDRLTDFERGLYAKQYQSRIDRALERAEEAQRAIDDARERTQPYEAEFRARGGWTRAFLVSGGHVHRSMSCSTCFPTTQYAWMTDYSGKSEDEIVEAAGERACTVCYPSAPVDTLRRPSKMLTPDEVAAAEAKKQRESAREAKRAEQEAKAITSPDGSELRDGINMPVRTVVAAERALVESLSDYVIAVERRRRDVHPDWQSQQEQVRDRLVAALAHKRGVSAEQVLAEAMERAQKKFKRDYGA